MFRLRLTLLLEPKQWHARAPLTGRQDGVLSWSLSNLTKHFSRLFARGSVTAGSRYLKLRNGAFPVANGQQRRPKTETRTAGFGHAPKRFAIVWNGILRLLSGHQQVTEKQVGIRKARVIAQRRLQLVLRLVELPRLPEHPRIVVPGCRIHRTKAQGGFKLLARLDELGLL
jgi:hypothetical protein